jgi:aspartate kinase
MKVFKFGGASVKDANSVKNVASILRQYPNQNIVVVVSAMGKVTDALERLTNAYFYPAEIKAIDVLNEIKKYHFNIIEQLFPDKNHPIYNEINNAFVELDWAIEEEPIQNYNHTYDQIVCMGEIISTKIVNAYLNEAAINSKWLDVRDFIQTDNTFREGKVDWSLTQQLVDKNLSPLFLPHPPSAPSPPDSYRDEEGKRKQSLGEGVILVTQGFIGGTSENFTTTLSREGLYGCHTCFYNQCRKCNYLERCCRCFKCRSKMV